MFVNYVLYPELEIKEREFSENKKLAGETEFYDRRNAKNNCKRVCKSLNPIVWLLPI